MQHNSRVEDLRLDNSHIPQKYEGGGGERDGDDDHTSGDIRSVVDTAPRVETPRLYKVLLLNDDYTPMDFVVEVLKRFFAKNEEAAMKIMLDVHQKGSGIAGVYSLETAEMKVMQVNQFARQNQHPLKCTLEPE
ncbi:MAG: ATP-dependent Clp protease adapter ClpS [Bdellovibrionaceae bacterium]|nr:ATP-dependent Clp protease adapter ClpS [Pseudobdellovibrionaceae bacterium]